MITTPTLEGVALLSARVMTRRCEIHPNRGSGHDTTRHETRSERRGKNERGDGRTKVERRAGVRACARAVLVNTRARCFRKIQLCVSGGARLLTERLPAPLCDRGKPPAGRLDRRRRRGGSRPGLVGFEPPTHARTRRQTPENVQVTFVHFLVADDPNFTQPGAPARAFATSP